MDEKKLEIIELPTGDIVLRRPEQGDEPLVNIRFHQQVKEFSTEARLQIAKAMIEAGITAYLDMEADNNWYVNSDQLPSRTIH